MKKWKNRTESIRPAQNTRPNKLKWNLTFAGDMKNFLPYKLKYWLDKHCCQMDSSFNEFTKLLKHVIFEIFSKRRFLEGKMNISAITSLGRSRLHRRLLSRYFFQNFAKISSNLSWQFRHTFVLLYDHYKIQRDHFNFSVLVFFWGRLHIDIHGVVE